MLTPGGTLGGRYQLTQRIASGGMGEVWKAEDTVLGRTVAVKVLQPAMLEEPGFAERFRGEARVMATLNHPGVVSVYDYGESPIPGGGNVAYLVMEFIEGETLAKVLSRVGRLTPDRALDLIAQAADALQAAHDRGIIHRDVKPGNLLVKPDGKLVLTDFGIARSALSGQLTQAGSVLGTAAYVSPEQASGTQVTPASDVYSLGVVAYQMLSGRRPFEGDNPLEVAMRHVRDNPPPLPADIPPAARHLVERAMAKDPAARWPSAAAMADAARGKDDVATRVVPQPPPPPRPAANPTSVMPAAARPTSPAGFSRGSAQVPTSAPPADYDTFDGGPYDPYDRGREQQPPRKSRAGLVLGIAAAFFVVALLGAGGYLLLNNQAAAEQPPVDKTTSAPPANTQPAGPRKVRINRNEFLRLDKEEARQKLLDMGFSDENIQIREDSKRGYEPGQVNGILPNNREVSTDEKITLFVQPAEKDDDDLPAPKPESPSPSESEDDDDEPSSPEPSAPASPSKSPFQPGAHFPWSEPAPDGPARSTHHTTPDDMTTHETMRDL